MGCGWQRKGSPTLTVAEENFGSSSTHDISVPAGTTMSRVGTTPRDRSLSAACVVAATPRQNTTSMMRSELDFMVVPPLWGPDYLRRPGRCLDTPEAAWLFLIPATHVCVAHR